MDNRTIDATLRTREEFELAMKLAFETSKTTAIGYAARDNQLILYSSKSSNANELPYPMKVDQAIDFVWGWLENTDPEKPQPDHDGSNCKAFRVFNDHWGCVDGEWQAFIAITPVWGYVRKIRSYGWHARKRILGLIRNDTIKVCGYGY